MGDVLKNKYVRILTILLLVQTALFYNAAHGDARKLRSPLSEFPRTLPGWQAVRDGVVDKETSEVLKANDIMTRLYARTAWLNAASSTPQSKDAVMANAVDLFVAYFETQQQGQSPHSPKNCLPGSGWQMIDSGELEVPISPQLTIKVNKYAVEKSGSQSLVLYWYQSHGRVVANEFSAKFYLVADSLRYHRSDTALVRVVIPVIQDDLAAAVDTGTNFVQSAFPVVYRYLPM